jgi:hypothetical protein
MLPNKLPDANYVFDPRLTMCSPTSLVQDPDFIMGILLPEWTVDGYTINSKHTSAILRLLPLTGALLKLRWGDRWLAARLCWYRPGTAAALRLQLYYTNEAPYALNNQKAPVLLKVDAAGRGHIVHVADDYTYLSETIVIPEIFIAGSKLTVRAVGCNSGVCFVSVCAM